MRRTAIALLVAVPAVAGITSCSASDPQPPQNDSQPRATESTPPQAGGTGAALPHSGAPKVSAPLPASVLTGDPCTEALTAEQGEAAGGVTAPGEPSQHAIGPKCDWSNQKNHSLAAVTYGTKTGEGLSATYENAKPQAVVWRELPLVQGFPAVAAVTRLGGRPEEFCQVTVGVADNLSFDVGVFLSDAKKGKTDPCDGAARVADMVMTNLRRKAGS